MRFLCLYVREAKQITRLTSTAQKTPIVGYQELVYWNEVLKTGQPASKLSYLGKRSEPRENERARGRGKEDLQRSLINFHFHPGKSGTPQSVKKRENCHRKRAADQKSNNRLENSASGPLPCLSPAPRGFLTTFLYALSLLSWSLEQAICKFDSSTEVQRSFVQPPRFTDRQQNGFAACDLSASLSKLIQEQQFSTAQKLQVATSSPRDKNRVACATRFSYRASDFVAMQGRQRNVPKSVLHVRNLILRLSNPQLFYLLVNKIEMMQI